MTKRIRKAALTLAWLIGTISILVLARVMMQLPRLVFALPNLTATISPIELATITSTSTSIDSETETPTPELTATETPNVTPTVTATASETPSTAPATATATQTTSQVTVEPVTSKTATLTATSTPSTTQTATVTVTPSGRATATPTVFPTAPSDHIIYLPSVIQYVEAVTCPKISINTYTLIDIETAYYKDNRLTDDNSDFRISVLGYTPSKAFLGFVTYGGDTDLHAPNFFNIVRSPAHPTFVATYQRNDWNWDESGPPPYGTRGGTNTEWPASVIDLPAVPGESVFIPSRNIPINSTGPFAAMVLYADEDELTVSYGTHDSVVDGYVVYLSNLCVDPTLVATYRAQLQNGFRFTRRLPVLLNTQPIGIAITNRVTVAVRDRAAFLDPRSEKDWWQNTPDARRLILGP